MPATHSLGPHNPVASDWAATLGGVAGRVARHWGMDQ